MKFRRAVEAAVALLIPGSVFLYSLFLLIKMFLSG